MKIVYLDSDSLGNTPLDEIAALGELVCYGTSNREQALARVGDCDVLIVNKVIVDDALMEQAPALKLVCVSATGMNNIDIEAATKRGIAVKNVAGYSTESVVQLTFMHVLSLLGHAPYFDRRVKDGTYSALGIFADMSRPFTEMAGKTYGIIGLGTIGLRVARVAQAFGMKVVYYSTSGTSHNTEFPSLSLRELLEVSDVVSVHAPLNARTLNLIGEEQLGWMKNSAVLVNVGRGGIVDETALARAIDEGVIAGAGLDVYAVEPLPADSPLLHTRHPENLRFTPHTAWASKEALTRLVSMLADNIRESFK